MRYGYYYLMKGRKELFSVVGMSQHYPGLVMMQSVFGSITNITLDNFDNWFTEYNP